MALIDDYVDAVWHYGTRTLADGVGAAPTTAAEAIAEAVWEYASRAIDVWVIGTGITLSRSVSGTTRLLRRPSPVTQSIGWYGRPCCSSREEYDDPLTPHPGDPEEYHTDPDHPYMEAAGSGLAVSILTANGGAGVEFEFSAALDGNDLDPPGPPTGCPDPVVGYPLWMYEPDADWLDREVRLEYNAEITGAASKSDSDSDTADTWQYCSLHDDLAHGGLGGDEVSCVVEFDKSVPISVEIRGTFECRASYRQDPDGDTNEPIIGASSDMIYPQYIFDHDPQGIVPLRLFVWYVPTSDIEVTASAGDINLEFTVSASDFESQAAFEEHFRNGFGQVSIESHGQMLGHTMYYCDAKELITDLEISGLPASTSETMGDLESLRSRVTFDGEGAFQHWATGYPDVGSNGTLTWVCPPFDANYSGSVLDSDGQPCSTNPVLGLDETDGPNYSIAHGDAEAVCDDDGLFTRGVHYDGWWTLVSGGGGGDDELEVKKVFAATFLDRTNDGYYHVHSTSWSGTPGENDTGGIVNLASLGEPIFPITTSPPDPEDGYDDSEVDLVPGITDLSWSAALEFSTDENELAIEFDSTDGWTVDPPGAAVLSIVDDKLKVVVSTNCSISRDYTGTKLTGWRFARLTHASDDTEFIEFSVRVGEADERLYVLTPTRDLLDLPGPHNAASPGTQQEAATQAPNWQWGVGDVGVVEIGGLRAGKTYTFADLTAERHPDGKISVLVFGDGPFVGDAAGDARESDTYTMWLDSDSGERWTQVGIVFVDGMPAAHLLGVRHWYDVGTDTYKHVPFKFSTSDPPWFTPSGGALSVDVAAGSGQWGSSDTETIYLAPGLYESHNDTLVGVRVHAAEVWLPLAYGDASLSIQKRLRGRVAVLVCDTEGNLGARTVRIVTTYGATEEARIEFDTDALGFGLSPALRQPIQGRAYTHEISVVDRDGDRVEGDVETRNRNATRLALVGLLPTNAAGADDLHVDRLTGMGMVAYVSGGNVMVARTYDHGKTLANAVRVAESAEDAAPSLMVAAASEFREWSVVYQKSGRLRRAVSTDGFSVKSDEVLV